MKIHSHLRVKHTVQEWHVYMYIHTVHAYMYTYTYTLYMYTCYMLTYTYMNYGTNLHNVQCHALLHNAWKQTVMMFGVEVYIHVYGREHVHVLGSYNWGKHGQAPTLCSLCSYIHVYVSYVHHAMHKHKRPCYTHKRISTSCKV